MTALALLAAEASAQPWAPAEPLEECAVIARINSEVILACELEWQLNLMVQQRFGAEASEAVTKSPGFAKAREQFLKQLTFSQIELVLLYSDFRSNAPQADIASIHEALQTPFEEREVPRLMEVVGATDSKDLEAKLISLGTSLGERRADFFRTMIARSWLTESLEFDKEITHEQMLDYYHANAAEFDQPRRVRWEELMARFDKHPTKQAAWRALAMVGNEAYEAAAATPAGQPAFETIAKTKSDGFTADEGGGHDWTAQGSLASQSVDDALFSLPVGQMSPQILEGPQGFHIVRVIQRREAGPTPFHEVQADIRAKLRDERYQASVTKKLADLKESAKIWTVFTGDLTADRLAELRADAYTR